jgi:hypothetical protein
LVSSIACPAATIVFAGSDEIEHRCTTRYPNVWQYFAWKDCVKTETQQELEENLKRESKEQARQREEQARPCLAADLARMEDVAAKVRQAIKSEWSLEAAQAALDPIIGREGRIGVPDDDIKDRVLVYSIGTKCDSPFHFLINVRAGPDQKLRWLRTWAEDPPAGYKAEYHSEFSVNFDAQRAEERSRAESAKREEEWRAAEAKAEKEREEMMTRIIKISDVKMTCLGTCAFRELDFVVTNISQQPIKDISFGWMLPPPQMTACPAKLATKETKYLVLQPGEKASLSISIGDAPGQGYTRYCLRVTYIGNLLFFEGKPLLDGRSAL